MHIQTPALREIPEDVAILANHFLQKHCAATMTELKQFTPGAMIRLTQHGWSGNARQLENEVKRLVASVRGKTIGAEYLVLQSQRKEESSKRVAGPRAGQTLFEALESLERKMIEDALNKTDGNKQKAAQLLGLSRQGLIKKLKRLGSSATVE